MLLERLHVWTVDVISTVGLKSEVVGLVRDVCFEDLNDVVEVIW